MEGTPGRGRPDGPGIDRVADGEAVGFAKRDGEANPLGMALAAGVLLPDSSRPIRGLEGRFGLGGTCRRDGVG